MTVLQELAKKTKEQPIEKSGDIYHPIPFEEFAGLKTSSSKKAVEKKWHLIKSTLEKIYNEKITNKKVLDVGANAGFYTFSFAKMSNEVTSFEVQERYSEITKVIIAEKGLAINWIDRYFDYAEKLPVEKFDVALLLSVYQWMAEGGEKLEYANRCLKRISEISDYLIFELGFNKGKSHIKTKQFNHYNELFKLIKSQTVYKHMKLIGKTRLWGYSRYLVICSNNASLCDRGLRKIIRSIEI